MYLRSNTPYLCPNALLLSRLTWNLYAVPFKPKVQGICSPMSFYTCFFICINMCKGLTDSTISSMNQIPSKTDLDNLETPRSSQIPWSQSVP